MIVDHALFYLLLASAIALVMTFGIGANDLANVLSTSIGSRSVTLHQAMLIAIIFEFAGALLGGQGVSHTISNGIFNLDLLLGTPLILIHGLISVLLATMIWINVASFLGLPVSITHATIGALVGFGMIVLGTNAIYWDNVAIIGLSWLFAPAASGVIAYMLFNSIQRLILGKENPLQEAKRYIGVYLFLVGLVLSNMILLKGLKHAGYSLSLSMKLFLMIGSSLGVVILGNLAIYMLPDLRDTKHRLRFIKVEKMFGILMAFTACAMVFAHGSNDVAVAVGPITLLLAVMNDLSEPQSFLLFPGWLLTFGCTGVLLGLLLYGRKVIATVGHNITALTPSRAFAATLAAASTVVVATTLGIPISATQTLVGGVLGVGLARGIGALNINVIRNIFMSWIITLPVTSGLAILFFYMIQATRLSASTAISF